MSTEISWAAAHRPEYPLLHRTQQLDLHGNAQFGHLVQKQGSMMGDFHQPLFVRGCPGERALAVTEKFAFQQGFGNPAAVDGHKGLIHPVALLVDGFGNQLFSGARSRR